MIELEYVSRMILASGITVFIMISIGYSIGIFGKKNTTEHLEGNAQYYSLEKNHEITRWNKLSV